MKMERFDLQQLVLMTTGVFLAIFLVGNFGPSDGSYLGQLDKRQIALWGGLELEHAVQALKDSILRGDSAYNTDFDRAMQEVERAMNLYRARGALGQDEEQALERLRTQVPVYRSAIETVQQMRYRNAPITEIDRAVKGQDRPISAAFEALEAAAAAQSRSAQRLRVGNGGNLVSTALVCAVLSGFLVALGQLALGRMRSKDGSLRDLAMKVVRWEEEKQLRASQRLHDGVCQSVAAVMYLLRGADSAALGPAGGSLRARIDGVLQGAIRDARAIAMDLCPPPIHDVGLLGSLESIWADARSRTPELKLAATSDVQESEIPAELKRELERLAPMAAEWARQEPGACQMVWTLTRERRRIRLGIGVQTDAPHADEANTSPERRRQARAAEAIADRMRLTGATTRGVQDVPGGQALIAHWFLR